MRWVRNKNTKEPMIPRMRKRKEGENINRLEKRENTILWKKRSRGGGEEQWTDMPSQKKMHPKKK